MLRWLTGSVSRADWPTDPGPRLVLLVLLPVLVWLARSLRVAELGEDAAAGLGVRRGARTLLLLRRPSRWSRSASRPPGRSRSSRSSPGRSPARSTAAGPPCSAPAWSAPLIVVAARLRRPTTCWPTSTSPSASSPAPSGRRSCSGCSRSGRTSKEGLMTRLTRPATGDRPAGRPPSVESLGYGDRTVVDDARPSRSPTARSP